MYEGNDALAKAGSLQAQRSHVLRTFSPLLTRQMPVLFPQTTILVLGRCQLLLNDSPYGHLHIKQQPRYAFSTVNRTPIYISSYTMGVLPSCILNVQCLLMYDLDYCHKTHDRACGFSATASGVAPARPKMLSIALVLHDDNWASGSKPT